MKDAATKSNEISIAVETSCRRGGLALARGDELLETLEFDAAGRHATQLVARLADLLSRASVTPADLSEVYVSTGPGGFTGLRVGITAVRTLAQAVGHLRCVAVPTARALANAATSLDWRNLAVLIDAREGTFYAAFFARAGQLAAPARAGEIMSADEFLAAAPRPITVIGEALAYDEAAPLRQAAGVTVVAGESHLHTPTARGVWHVGRQLATAGSFTEYHHLLPIYARQMQAVRLQQQGRAK